MEVRPSEEATYDDSEKQHAKITYGSAKAKAKLTPKSANL